MDDLERRVVQAAEAVLAQRRVVSAVEVLVGMRWLTPAALARWQQGRVEDLESVVQVNLHKLSAAMAVLRRWARDQGLRPSETAYLARTRDRRPLRFSRSGEDGIERAYRTHWVSPELSDAKRQRMAERQGRPPELVVISPLNEWTCTTCSGGGELLIMEGPGPVCLVCADMDHLIFLPTGHAALTRRAKRASGLSAVVVRFSRARRRYERQGVLVEEAALVAAEAECLADDEARRRRRARDEIRRAAHDDAFGKAFAAEISRMFPGCPPERAAAIAGPSCTRRSGRVGRSAAGRALHPDAVRAAVVASVRHVDTSYDGLLMAGVPRAEARDRVNDDLHSVLEVWRSGPSLSVPEVPQ
jgi:hypothetical protein